MSNIFYIQSYDIDLNIGGGYNRHIQHLPEDAVIVITDHDTNFLVPDFGRQINEVADKHLGEYALLGCRVSRLGGLHQCYNNEFSNNHDMKHHYDIALKLLNENYSEVTETTGVAGCFMMFRKSTWEAVGGFAENTNKADTIFNKAIKAKGLGKIGIIEGVYMYHCYRIHQSNHKKAWMDIQHLTKAQ